MGSVKEAKGLIAEMCRNFYTQGWVSGTGGGMSIKVGDKIVMAPSGVQKERMRSEDMFVLSGDGSILETPESRPPPAKPPKLSECSPLFMAAYELRGAGAVLHSHSINAVLATLLQDFEGQGCVGEFRVTNLEMIKGIAGHGYFDECVVPIIQNTARESELTASLRAAIQAYPRANAVLVQRHGVYVWGDTWVQAKTQAECYEYLFEAAVRLRSLGIDVARAPPHARGHATANGHASTEGANGHAASEGGAAPKKAKLGHKLPRAIVLDIEGTIAPISFVTDVLFPYARQHLEDHLQRTFSSAETTADIKLLRQEAEQATDAAGVSRRPELSTVSLSDKAAAIKAVVDFVVALMEADKKTTGLKSLQGHIWRQGFESGELRSQLFPDVVPALREWVKNGIKVYVYSSGSREAQRNLFKHSVDGDLRPYISGFFDTVVGPKVQASSYSEIALSLGVDSPGDILFATDSVKEADAATDAQWQVALTERPGNQELPREARVAYRVLSDLTQLVPGQ